MADRNIIYLTDVKMITCVLQNGLGEDVLEAAKNAGAQGATASWLDAPCMRARAPTETRD